MLEKQHFSRSPARTNADFPALIPFLSHGKLRRMDLSDFARMDPHLLVGLLNTELRNRCDSLDDLVKTHHLDAKALVARMAESGYDYRPEQNQFR